MKIKLRGRTFKFTVSVVLLTLALLTSLVFVLILTMERQKTPITVEETFTDNFRHVDPINGLTSRSGKQSILIRNDSGTSISVTIPPVTLTRLFNEEKSERLKKEYLFSKNELSAMFGRPGAYEIAPSASLSFSAPFKLTHFGTFKDAFVITVDGKKHRIVVHPKIQTKKRGQEPKKMTR